ncbi:MAG: molybdopterin molybdotransferase MoeA [Chloroflexi bacterium]|nr:molybdopterin molybdotransferase MoeA [Chloroflexota bacterium]
MQPPQTPAAARYELISVAEAYARILEHTPILDTEHVETVTALGRVLAEDVVARQNIPQWPTAAVDGYAIVAADSASERRVLEEIGAGHVGTERVTLGTAARIMTGAPIPDGADAVVMVEETSEHDGIVTLPDGIRSGQNVHRTGIDVTADQVVLERGAVIGPPEIGLLCTLGIVEVPVYRRPRVAVVSTGDELVEPAETPGPGQIRDSNRYAILAAVQDAGGIAISGGIARDDEAEHERVMTSALAEADVLLTSGGVSMGTRDLIKPILERLGTVHFGRIKFKPGKPLTFATIGSKLVFGLPGYPVSSLVTFEVFVRPALLKMQGRRRFERARVELELERDATRAPDRTEYQRVVARWEAGRLVARTTGAQSSSRLLSMTGANALAIVEPGSGTVPAGSTLPGVLTGEPE